MKKYIFVLKFLMVCTGVFAQGIDSLMGIPSRYMSCENYQQCENFQYCSVEYMDRNYFHLDFYAGRGDTTEVVVTKCVTNCRLAIKGVAVMTITNWDDVNPNQTQVVYYDPSRVDEEVMMWNGDGFVGVAPMATVAWNDKNGVVEMAAPQCVQTMYDGDSSKFLHFGLSEVYFDHSVYVDSVFYVGGTLRNNALVPNSHTVLRFFHKPTLYPYLTERYANPCDTCVYDPGHYAMSSRSGGDWRRLDEEKMWSGPFFLILDTNFCDNNDTVSLEKVENAGPQFSLYPNPVTDELFVAVDGEGQMLLKLYDASGREVGQRFFFDRTSLDVKSMPAGVYYVMVIGEKGSRVEAFVKR